MGRWSIVKGPGRWVFVLGICAIPLCLFCGKRFSSAMMARDPLRIAGLGIVALCRNNGLGTIKKDNIPLKSFKELKLVQYLKKMRLLVEFLIRTSTWFQMSSLPNFSHSPPSLFPRTFPEASPIWAAHHRFGRPKSALFKTNRTGVFSK